MWNERFQELSSSLGLLHVAGAPGTRFLAEKVVTVLACLSSLVTTGELQSCRLLVRRGIPMSERKHRDLGICRCLLGQGLLSQRSTA